MVKSESKKRRRIVEERQKGYVSDLDLGDGDYMNWIHHQSVRFIVILSPAIKVPVSLNSRYGFICHPAVCLHEKRCPYG